MSRAQHDPMGIGGFRQFWGRSSGDVGRRPSTVRGVIVLASVASLLAVAVLWWVLRDRQSSDAPAAEQPPAPGIVIELQQLGFGGNSVAAGSAVPLVVSAAGAQPLRSIELWADDRQVERIDVPPGELGHRAAVDWISEPGDVVLTARASDGAGHTALSNAVRLTVVESTEPTLASVLAHPVVEGDTLASIATAYAVPAQLVALANPGGFDAEARPIQPTVMVPVQLDAAQVAAGQAPEQSGVTPSGFRRAARDEPARPAPSSPEPPVDVELSGCEATVRWTGAETAPRMSVNMLAPGTRDFAVVATGGIDEPISFPVPPGSSRLVIGTYDATVQELSAPITVQPDTSCDGGWSGDARLVGQRLVTERSADSAYLYVSIGDGWQRVPPDGSVTRAGEGFDFTGLLPDLGNGEVDVEAWGRAGGELVELGSGHRAAGAAPWESAPSVVRTQLWWVKAPATSGSPEQLATIGFAPDAGELTFRWKASSPKVTAGFWQVTTYQPPVLAGLDLPGVLAQGVVTGSNGTFTIDFSAFVDKPQVASASVSATLGGMALAGAAVLGSGSQPAGTGQVAVSSSGVGPLDAAAISSEMVASAIPPPTRFYVRLVPFIGSTFTGRASNHVLLDTEIEIDPGILGAGPIGLPESNSYHLSVNVVPPSTPSPWMAKCWMITEIDPMQFDPQYSYLYPWMIYLQNTQYAGTVCPVCYKSGGGSIDFAGYYGWACADDSSFSLTDPSTWSDFPILGPLVSGLVQVTISVWDFVVEVATYLKAKVVELVSLVGCQSFVNAGSAAAGKTSPSEAEKWCNAVAEIAVDAALISAGIPPTLPNFEQLVQLGKGELVDVIVAQASALGIPCDEADLAGELAGDDTLTCAGLASALIDEVVEVTKAAVTASAQATSGIFFPPGVTAVPHPNGLEQPPTVGVTVTPNPGAPFSGITCPATVLMLSSYTPPASWFGSAKMPDLNVGYDTNYGMSNGLWLASQAYAGFVVQPTTIKLPTLPSASGKLSPASSTYTLGQLTGHDPIPATTYWYSGSPMLHLEIPYASVHVHPGATLTTTIVSACADDITVIGTIQPNRKLTVTKVIE